MSNTNARSAASANGARGNRGTTLLLAAVLVALTGVTAVAQAADPAKTPDGSLTWNGITLYGIVDIGVQYQSAGAPVSDYFPAGTESVIQKNSHSSVTTVVGSNLGQSRIGLQGREEFGNGWAGVFKLETFINPWSGHVADALKSLTLNNGVPAASQNTGVDSSIAGQFFGGAAYGGITNAQFGTITVGRQNGLLADGVGKYDPMGASNAFSLVGFSGTYAGGGVTEDRRLDNSIKYDLMAGNFHFGAQFQPTTSSNPGTTQELVLGFTFPGGSIDAYYMQKNDAISAGSLSVAQAAQLPCPYAAPVLPALPTAPCKALAGGGGNALDKALSGTISDNTTTAVMAKYSFSNKTTVFATYEHIDYQNPTHPVAPGQATIGGYTLAYVNNTPYPSKRTLGVIWAGVKVPVSSRVEISGAVYRQDQNAYWTKDPGCAANGNTVSGQCSGALNVLSFVADYRFTKRFDLYGGAMWTQVQGGLANGYTFNTSSIDPTIGVRYSF